MFIIYYRFNFKINLLKILKLWLLKLILIILNNYCWFKLNIIRIWLLLPTSLLLLLTFFNVNNKSEQV